MLKKVIINQKKVPVPVPIQTLAQALAWIEATLVPAGHTLTKVTLNDKVLINEDSRLDVLLTAETKLEVQIDSPVELAVQTLEAARNLGAVIFSGLKALAVDCWQAKPAHRPTELASVSHDISLVLDLSEHIVSLVEPMGFDVSAVQGITCIMKRVAVSLTMAASSSDWKACARLLLNRLEPLLKDFNAETESLQMRVVAQSGYALTGEGRR